MPTLPVPRGQRKPPPDEASPVLDLTQFHTQAAGLVEGRIVPLDCVPLAALDALGGDPAALAFMHAVAAIYNKAMRRQRPLCGNCDNIFWRKKLPGGFL